MNAGTQVRIKADPARKGIITGKYRQRARRTYWQVSFVDGLTDFVLEAQLAMVSSVPDDPVELFKNGNFGRARDLRGNLTYIRLNGRLANLIYSMETTNTDFYPYQFKPVVNFLESPGDGILIAIDIPIPDGLEADELTPNEYCRIAVAYGLATRQDRIGKITPPGAIEDIERPKVNESWRGHFIDKEMT